MEADLLQQIGPTKEALGKSGATKFSMRGLPLLSQGASFDAVATADNLWLSVKVYSSGGENALHVHTVEDHAFVVLQGHATFYFGDGTSCEAMQYEGVMLPKGVSYRFNASEEENLVLLRIGAAQRKTTGIGDLQKHGTPMELKGTVFDEDGTAKNGRGGVKKTPNPPIIRVPDKFFPDLP
jgi:mannose-6-phosphate isomerase-like protein (cupin superfamily)